MIFFRRVFRGRVLPSSGNTLGKWASFRGVVPRSVGKSSCFGDIRRIEKKQKEMPPAGAIFFHQLRYFSEAAWVIMCDLFFGRPPFLPFSRAARVFSFDLFFPPRRPIAAR